MMKLEDYKNTSKDIHNLSGSETWHEFTAEIIYTNLVHF